MMVTTNNRQKKKKCRTVGDLIKALETLPKTAKLSEPMEVTYYNLGETAKKLGLKPCAGISECW